MSAVALVVYIAWGIFWVYWFISALRTRSQTVRQQSSLSRWLHWILMILGYWVLFSDPALLWRFLPDNIVVKLIGILILFSGLSFAIWARIHLGQYWSGRITIKVDHKLIRTGPYKIVRHPIYTGIMFGFIGSVIVSGEMSAILAFILMLAALLIKISEEEKFLVEEFGPTYIQYKQEVKSLIPFII